MKAKGQLRRNKAGRKEERTLVELKDVDIVLGEAEPLEKGGNGVRGSNTCRMRVSTPKRENDDDAPIIFGGTPTTALPIHRAIGFNPSASATSRRAKVIALAPSLI